MPGHFQRRFRIALVASFAAVLGWFFIPGSPVDRQVFLTISRASAKPPFFVSGNGSHVSPWTLRTLASQSTAEDVRKAPVVVSLGDDHEGVFQTIPPSPIDLAVVLNNIHRLGGCHAATSVVLAWDSPDAIGLAALDRAIARFDSIVMAAPLSRGAVPEMMPASFRKASIPLGEIKGAITELPIVNRIPIPGIILGGENTMAGFQNLDSEPDNASFPMLARWGDRAVFSFPLLVALQRLNLPLQGIQVRLGESIKLGPDGPTIPIDSYGRLGYPPPQIDAFAKIPTAALIDGGADLIPKSASKPVILRDDRSAAESNTRMFSRMLPGLVAAISSNVGLSPELAYRRLHPAWEGGGLFLLVVLLTAFSKLRTPSRNKIYLLIAGMCVTAQIVTAVVAAMWLPGLAALAAVCGAFLVSRLTKKSTRVKNPRNPLG